MKLTITITALLFCQLSSFCQNENWQIDEKTNLKFSNSPYIFEGEIIRQETLRDSASGKIYSVKIIQIKKIFRGHEALQPGTVAIYRLAGHFYPRKETDDNGTGYVPLDAYVSHQYIPPKKGIYFCQRAKPLEINIPTTNSIQFWVGFTLRAKKGNVQFDSHRLKEYQFDSMDQAYSFIEQLDNTTRIDIHVIESKEKQVKPAPKKKVNEDAGSERKPIDYRQRKENYQKNFHFSQLKSQLANASKQYVARKPNPKACRELFISEYVHGSYSEVPFPNNAIEIYNPQSIPVNLATYSIEVYTDGSTTPTRINLSGFIQPHQPYVVANPISDVSIIARSNLTASQLAFDGNDAVVLRRGKMIIDKIGEIGINPGTNGWTTGAGSTHMHTLIRSPYCMHGQPDWTVCKTHWIPIKANFNKNLQKHKSFCAKPPPPAADLEFSFENPQITGSGTQYFEFDIYASATSNSTYFDQCLIKIAYNTTAFGTYVVGNNKVTITKASSFNSATYNNPNVDVIDDTSSVISVALVTDFQQTSWNRTQLTTTPIPMLHFKIEIAQCNVNTDLEFTDVSFTPLFSFYTINANDDLLDVVSYNNTNYLNDLNIVLCEFDIYSFTSPVYPGKYYKGTIDPDTVMVINGAGFGNTRGNGNVYFLNANDGGSSYVPLNNYDFRNWSDTKIEIIVPSKIDSFPLGSSIEDWISLPGTGLFYVKTDAGDSVFSKTPVEMPYAIVNASGNSGQGYGKFRIDLVDVDGLGGITWHLDTSITNYPDPMLEVCVRKAIKDWICATDVHFTIGNDTTVHALMDGVSTIAIKNSLGGDKALAITKSAGYKPCYNSTTGYVSYFPIETDINLIRNPSTLPNGSGLSWFFDTLTTSLPANTIDFYDVILHELGHGHLLNHVNSDDLMYYSEGRGPLPLADRNFIESNDVDGGIEVVNVGQSVSYSIPCTTSTGPMLPAQADSICFGFTLGNRTLNQPESDLNLFPNPVIESVYISFHLHQKSNVDFRLIDYTGKVIDIVNMENQPTGKYTQQFPTGNLASGLYLITALINGSTHSFKFIKQ